MRAISPSSVRKSATVSSRCAGIGDSPAPQRVRHEHGSADAHEAQRVLDVLDDGARVGIHQDDVVARLVHPRQHLERATGDEARPIRGHSEVGECALRGLLVLDLDVDGGQRRVWRAGAASRGR